MAGVHEPAGFRIRYRLSVPEGHACRRERSDSHSNHPGCRTAIGYWLRTTLTVMYPIRIQKTIQFDLQSVLGPIPGESPTGESLRYEGTYDKIRDARTEDDAVLSRGVWKMPLKRADWSDVAEMCLDALQNRSKDLQIAAWQTEAWLHLYGLDGLSQGLRVITGLCSAYWDDLHPRPDSGDSIEYRVGPIEWINDKLAPVIRLLPLTDPSSDDVKA